LINSCFIKIKFLEKKNKIKLARKHTFLMNWSIEILLNINKLIEIKCASVANFITSCIYLAKNVYKTQRNTTIWNYKTKKKSENKEMQFYVSFLSFISLLLILLSHINFLWIFPSKVTKKQCLRWLKNQIKCPHYTLWFHFIFISTLNKTAVF
jgi:hypothetical protein